MSRTVTGSLRVCNVQKHIAAILKKKRVGGVLVSLNYMKSVIFLPDNSHIIS